MDCACVTAKVSVSGDVAAKVSCAEQPSAQVSVGTVTIRDGTNDYERLVNLPSIDGTVLKCDRSLGDIGVGDITPQAIDTMIYG